MKNTLLTIAGSVIASVLAAFLLITCAPLSLFNGSAKPSFGSTSITTILGTDTLSASRTTLNNNFASLNTNKVEVSDLGASTTLPQITTLAHLATVGTITSGTWNASIVTVPFGGTGSSTLSSNQLLIGNGTSGVKTPLGWGTSGQQLVSNGASVLPSWQSAAVDTTQNYIWSGTDNYTGTLFAKTLIASSTIQINNGGTGVSYSFPTTQGAINTFLRDDGSGNLSWISTSNLVATSTASSTTVANTEIVVASTTIPANTLGTGNIIRMEVPITVFTDNGVSAIIRSYYGTTALTCNLGTPTVTSMMGDVVLTVMEVGTTNSQNMTSFLTMGTSLGNQINCTQSGTATEDDTVNKILKVSVQFGNGTPTFTMGPGVVSLMK